MSLQHNDPAINAILQLLESQRDGAIASMSAAVSKAAELEKENALLREQLDAALAQLPKPIDNVLPIGGAQA